MRVTSLGSGSTGNALLVEAGPRRRTRLLVDAGLSSHVLLERLRQVGVAPSQLQGILVTHEHSDHITGLPSLMYRYSIPAIADPRTLDALGNLYLWHIPYRQRWAAARSSAKCSSNRVMHTGTRKRYPNPASFACWATGLAIRPYLAGKQVALCRRLCCWFQFSHWRHRSAVFSGIT